MSITNYTDLTSNIIAYEVRGSDSLFSAQTDTFIQLAEADFNRNLRSRRMETSVVLTTDATGLAALPTDFLEARSLTVTNGNLLTSLTLISQGANADLFPITTGGDPYAGYIQGSSLYIQPMAIRSVTLVYMQKFVGLSASTATNWIITQHPDLYLWGSLAQAAIWLQDDAKFAKFTALKQAVEDEILSRYGIEYYANAELTLDFVTP